jgi:tryptophan-rich sensory protein
MSPRCNEVAVILTGTISSHLRHVDASPALMRALGVVWALLSLAFTLAGVITWQHRQAWARVLALVAVVSLTFGVIALWSSIIGVFINLALIGVVAIGEAFSCKQAQT